jgi:hypothetical protein
MSGWRRGVELLIKVRLIDETKCPEAPTVRRHRVAKISDISPSVYSIEARRLDCATFMWSMLSPHLGKDRQSTREHDKISRNRGARVVGVAEGVASNVLDVVIAELESVVHDWVDSEVILVELKPAVLASIVRCIQGSRRKLIDRCRRCVAYFRAVDKGGIVKLDSQATIAVGTFCRALNPCDLFVVPSHRLWLFLRWVSEKIGVSAWIRNATDTGRGRGS